MTPGPSGNAADGGPLPRTMRAAVQRGPRQLAVEEVPVPVPGPRQVLVRVLAVGTCGSDVHFYEEGRLGDWSVDGPLILGHEPSGVIVAAGSGVTRRAPGERVSIEPGTPCGGCEQCRRGRYNLCLSMHFFAMPGQADGAFAEFALAHEDFVHPVPDRVSDEAAALLEPLSVGVWACRKARVAPGDRVLITGAGPIGLVALQSARAFGAAEVVVSDVNPHRLALAAELGASAVLNVAERPLAESGFEPHVLLECSGFGPAVADAVRQVSRAGRVVLVGMGGDEVSLPLSRLQQYELEITGTFRYAHTWPTALGLVASGEVDLDRLVTHRYGLADTELALTSGTRDATSVKAVVLPQQ
ncbi:NAD(P)-dependent alcohol dehydrogenase [Streptomyces pinistramenti]|uniref:NAD(P)-dependent alcohol dehydrogenase n=1 Tax=Streptomyces pinistramenti TaxID=2884812 RepID=UPI001D093457|nr:NAD(P)-dependent alcohol dehydrogenase [Streptomyces pinistramenti]MCB5910224.1 NAD(P)-dependent alcohol dehydrogenase [Streptomyces pinistramenti]